MRSAQLHRLLLAASVCLVVASSATYVRAQAGSFNLTKTVMDKKGAIVWKAAPENAIKQDVCNMMSVCNGPTKLIAFQATEGGMTVGRGLFLTQDAKHADVILLERQTPADIYFFLLGPDGNLAKTVYAQVTSSSWQQMGNALSAPTFEKEKAAWQKRLGTLGNAPPPAAAPKGDGAAQ